MKALLMYRDRDFVTLEEVPRTDRYPRTDPMEPLSALERALIQDLELRTLLTAMAGGDEFLFAVAVKALLPAVHNDVETILHRQAVLRDFLDHPELARQLYAVAVEAIEGRKKHWWGLGSSYPMHVLHSSISLLEMYLAELRKLREIAEQNAGVVRSEGLAALFATLRKELSDDYLATVERHLAELKFRGGVLVSAELGPRHEGKAYALREDPDKRHPWLKRLLRKGPRSYTFYLHPRDEAGGKILTALCDRGVNDVANALGQSTEHVLGFFEILRTELAFYVGCLNLKDKLTAIGASVCVPQPEPVGARRYRFSGLYDVCLALAMGQSVVANGHDADHKSLVVITGANQGGKSTFLRGVGVAQLMLQAGMFVGADALAAEVCTGLFTHYKREEDATMKSGKLDEELARMSGIADAVTPNSLVLFNESFAATNEREGSEIARQVVSALLERDVKVFFVTHLYDFAHSFYLHPPADALFLRAERRPDGTRTLKLIQGEPLETSYGTDLYKEVFGATPVEAVAG
jgi:DNA mismatch repair ATPase MutS